MTGEKAMTRRRYSRDFKAQVMAECDAPGASVARVAMSHGINTNVVHGWRKRTREAGAGAMTRQKEFVPIEVASAPAQIEHGIEVELRRGAVTMRIVWPSSATADFAAWTRELLR